MKQGLTKEEAMDVDWIEGLCADDIELSGEARIQGGTVALGERARVSSEPSEGARAFAGSVVTIRAIAVGSKGRGPFRKRLWVALQVQSDAGELGRVLANDLQRED